MVDDPYEYGLIAAANSLSDIYAMGGEPFLALNIAAFPPQLPVKIASEILRGGTDKALEAGVVIAGGHTIQDKEPKYGLVALGFVKTDSILTKGGLEPGDILFLSKPIGSGIIASAIKTDKINQSDAAETLKWMKRLNREAAVLAMEFGAHSATDITGYSLLGHAWEMASESGVGLKLYLKSIPFFPYVEQLSAQWCFPGGGFDNAEYFGRHIKFAPGISQETQLALFDPQTSGGLLFSLSEEKATLLEQEKSRRNFELWKIGEVTATNSIEVV